LIQKARLLELMSENLRKCNEHRVMPIEGTNFAYIPIAKNGCSSLKTWVYQVKHGEVLESAHFGKVNDELFWRSTEELLSSPLQYFVVLRDPLERLFSCYANKILPGRTAKPDSRFFVDGVFNRFHDYNEIFGEKRFTPDMEFEDFALVIAELPDLLGDNHTNSQVTFAPFYRKDFLKKSRIVLLPDVNAAMKELFGEKILEEVPLLHRMKSEAVLDREQVSASCIAQVQRRYQRDYDLLNTLQSMNLIWSLSAT
jgi:hypothetical protein